MFDEFDGITPFFGAASAGLLDETEFLQNAARTGIVVVATTNDAVIATVGERKIEDGVASFGGEAIVPVWDAHPETQHGLVVG